MVKYAFKQDMLILLTLQYSYRTGIPQCRMNKRTQLENGNIGWPHLDSSIHTSTYVPGKDTFYHHDKVWEKQGWDGVGQQSSQKLRSTGNISS